MLQDYFKEAKENLEKQIPEYSSPEFKKIGDNIRRQLQKREQDYFLLLRSLKSLILGDWHKNEQKQRLCSIKNLLLKNGLYAETIDNYYSKKGRLSQMQVLEACCITHQLIIFIDGEGAGTITEQNYLAKNYMFHGKILFFIEESKFNKFKDDPSQYFKNFPTIIPYKESELLDKILVYSRFRIHRLAEIIEYQSRRQLGLRRPDYKSWKWRLKGRER
ncbi:MAG: hypothetical protein HYW05_04630 [Candidatus Diapherotrites archaeon]|nr:hypothetical protein [Candidatus Diapherotrites archaeon]